MSKSLLSWISDDDLLSAVSHLLATAKRARENAVQEFGKNVIDPFSALFEISGFELDYDMWIKSEENRQAQKTLQNHIGDFHQKILGSVKDWENKHTGNIVDLVSHKHKVIAEIKNKFNTVSGGKLSDLYYSLESAVMPKVSVYKGFTAYYVSIIPKNAKRFNKTFTPSDKNKGEKCRANDKIREIDGASFYSLVAGRENALEELFDILPTAISTCSNGEHKVNNPEKIKLFFNVAFE